MSQSTESLVYCVQISSQFEDEKTFKIATQFKVRRLKLFILIEGPSLNLKSFEAETLGN